MTNKNKDEFKSDSDKGIVDKILDKELKQFNYANVENAISATRENLKKSGVNVSKKILMQSTFLKVLNEEGVIGIARNLEILKEKKKPEELEDISETEFI